MKQKKYIKIISFIMCIVLIITNIHITKIMDNEIAGSDVEHTHIYTTTYDDYYHWEYCTICDEIQNKKTHILTGNGGSKLNCENGYCKDSYRDICECGYQSLPWVVVHGRYENYVNSTKLNYGSMTGYYLENIKQITYSQFQETYTGTVVGQEYTWTDHDGDGYGWVFCGGPISSANNKISTLELILGEGNIANFGRNSEFDEMYELCEYIYNHPTATKQEFVDSLKSKEELDTDHLLYGMKEKYAAITDTQWTEIVKNFKGYNVHAWSWGWGSMCILHSGHRNSGQTMYSNGSCCR